MSDQNKALREQLVQTLRGGESHIVFDSAVENISLETSGLKPEDGPHTIWQLLEHLRIAQHDILEFSRNPKHKSPKWPDEYWPKTDAPPSKKDWDESVKAFQHDAKAMEALVTNPAHDLFKPIEGGDGQTLLRETLVLAAHNSYHLGQLMYLKKLLSPAE